MTKIDEVRSKILASIWYEKGEAFRSSDVSSLCGLATKSVAKYLSVLADEGTLDRGKTRSGHSTVTVYRRPDPKVNLLHVSWRKHSDEDLGVA